MVRLISMAMTGYYRTMQRPRAHQPLSMLKYDPIGTASLAFSRRAHEYRGFPTSSRRCKDWKGAMKDVEAMVVAEEVLEQRLTGWQYGNRSFSSKRSAGRSSPATTRRFTTQTTMDRTRPQVLDRPED